MTRVLVVDDSATTRRIVRKALTMSGVPNGQIREAANGLEALSKIGEDPPQLILSDVNMPLMDGFELLSEMNERGFMGVIPVVMITSRSSARDRKRLVDLGAETVIKKPFPMHALRTYIEPYLVPDEPDAEQEPELEAAAELHIVESDSTNEELDSLGSLGEREFADALLSSLGTTLELTAFLVATPAEIPTNADTSVYYYASLSITEGHQGRLWLAGPSETMDQFVDFGEAPPGEGNVVALRADALTELVNSLAGEFCSDLLGCEESYAFGLPVCDVLLGGDDRLDGGYVFCLEEPDQILVIGYQPGIEARAGDFASEGQH